MVKLKSCTATTSLVVIQTMAISTKTMQKLYQKEVKLHII